MVFRKARRQKGEEGERKKECISRLEFPMAVILKPYLPELPAQMNWYAFVLPILFYDAHCYASHYTSEDLQVLSSSVKVSDIQNLGKTVHSGSNVNVYTVINNIYAHLYTYSVHLIMTYCI